MHSPAVTGKTSPFTYTPDLTRKKVEKLIFSRVDMGRFVSHMAGTTDNNGAFDLIITKMRRGHRT
jgi:hypothetical protein